jgi:hypothetical protein
MRATMPNDAKVAAETHVGQDGPLTETDQRRIHEAVRGTRITELWFRDLDSPVQAGPGPDAPARPRKGRR